MNKKSFIDGLAEKLAEQGEVAKPGYLSNLVSKVKDPMMNFAFDKLIGHVEKNPSIIKQTLERPAIKAQLSTMLPGMAKDFVNNKLKEHPWIVPGISAAALLGIPAIASLFGNQGRNNDTIIVNSGSPTPRPIIGNSSFQPPSKSSVNFHTPTA